MFENFFFFRVNSLISIKIHVKLVLKIFEKNYFSIIHSIAHHLQMYAHFEFLCAHF